MKANDKLLIKPKATAVQNNTDKWNKIKLKKQLHIYTISLSFNKKIKISKLCNKLFSIFDLCLIYITFSRSR